MEIDGDVVVLPGDIINDEVNRSEATNISIGNGLELDTIDRTNDINNVIIKANIGGVLRRNKNHFSIISESNVLYSPVCGDQVVGIIDDKGADFYRINIRSSALAILNRLSFEGATKRNKPEYKRGDVVYCRVVKDSPDMDIELTCISNTTSKKQWSSGETIYGGVGDGLCVYVPMMFAKYLLRSECVMLDVLSKYFPFEIAIGVNGIVWFRAQSLLDTIIIRNVLLNGQNFDDQEIPKVIDMIYKKAKSSSRGK